MKASAVPAVPDHDNAAAAERLIRTAIGLLNRIPDSLIALLGRFSIAAVFWKSGQTKVQDFAIDIVGGEFQFGLPRLSDSVVVLFRDEYRLPLLSPAPADRRRHRNRCDGRGGDQLSSARCGVSCTRSSATSARPVSARAPQRRRGISATMASRLLNSGRQRVAPNCLPAAMSSLGYIAVSTMG